MTEQHRHMAMDNRAPLKGYGVPAAGMEIGPYNFMRRRMDIYEVHITIMYCGVSRQDVHYAYNELKNSIYPLVPGHEIIGIVKHAGNLVHKHAVGDLVAVGAMVNSCRQCEYCAGGREQYCANGGPTCTYNSHDRQAGEPYPTGVPTMGGYSQYIIVDQDFVVKVPSSFRAPAALPRVAPLLCAGITVYNALIVANAGPGLRVGVAGIGGLGHLAVKMAKAMGADVTAFTTSRDKTADLTKWGADHIIVSTDATEMRRAVNTINILINTIPVPHAQEPYLECIRVDGTMWVLGLLQDDSTPVNIRALTLRNGAVAGSFIGGIARMQEMLNWCAGHAVLADVEVVEPAFLSTHFDKIQRGEARYRYVLDNKLIV